MKLTSWRSGAAALIALAALSTPALAARDMCKLLKDKGILDELEFNECKAAQEKEDAGVETKAKDTIAAKLPAWTSMITPFGDLRLREEGFYGTQSARNRFRLRARLGLTVAPNDELATTIRLASGNPDDPLSTNQSFERTFTRKPISLDQAFITLKPYKSIGLQTPGWFTIVGGKFAPNAYRTSELVWDDDLSPEGATEILNLVETKEGLLRGLRVSAFQWTVNEVAAGPDTWMYGGQAVADTALTNTTLWSFGLADYYWDHLNRVARRYISPTLTDPKDPTKTVSNSERNSNLAATNRLVRDKLKNIVGYESGYNILNANTEINFASPFGLGIPAGLFADLAYNTQSDSRNVGINVGAGIGRAGKGWYANSLKNAGDWGFSYTFARVEQDSVLSLFAYSDSEYFQTNVTKRGSTNLITHILRADYALFSNFQLTGKVFFVNELDRKASNVTLNGNATAVRTQLDAVVKF